MTTRTTIVSPMATREHRTLRMMRRDEWPVAWANALRPPFEVWISNRFLVQLFHDAGHVRVSVNRVAFNVQTHAWAEGITWDELQKIKQQIGRQDQWAVECYPPDGQIVNVANLRHLWLLDEPPIYGWRS